MAKTLTPKSIDTNTGAVTFDVVYNAFSKTFVGSGLPLNSKKELQEAAVEHVRAFLAGRKAEKVAQAAADVTAIVNQPQTIDVGEEV